MASAMEFDLPEWELDENREEAHTRFHSSRKGSSVAGLSVMSPTRKKLRRASSRKSCTRTSIQIESPREGTKSSKTRSSVRSRVSLSVSSPKPLQPVKTVLPPAAKADTHKNVNKVLEEEDSIPPSIATTASLSADDVPDRASTWSSRAPDVVRKNSVSASSIVSISIKEVDNEELSPHIVDTWEFMKQGTALLKFTTFSKTHFKAFFLSEDCRRICWFSKNKRAIDSQIMVKDINAIELCRDGRDYAHLGVHKTMFTIVYRNRKKKLDLCAQTEAEYAIWVKGLRSLLRACRDRSRMVCRIDISKCSGIDTRVKYFSRKRSFVERELSDLKELYHELQLQCELNKVTSSIHYEYVQKFINTLKKSEAAFQNDYDETALYELDRAAFHLRNGLACLSEILQCVHIGA